MFYVVKQAEILKKLQKRFKYVLILILFYEKLVKKILFFLIMTFLPDKKSLTKIRFETKKAKHLKQKKLETKKA